MYMFDVYLYSDNNNEVFILNKKIMKTPEFTIETKKVGAGQFQVIVTDSANDEIKSYVENDMTLYDALTEEDGLYNISQWDAMQMVIRKAGFDN